MYEAAVSQLSIAAETCEHNAPIFERDGNAEQAEHSRANAKAYRAAITALRGIEEDAKEHGVPSIRAQALEMALRTPRSLDDHHDVLLAAKAYEEYLIGK